MPELPEVETVCRGLKPKLEGQRLQRVTIRRADLRFPFPKNFAERLTGCKVEQIERRAKFILMHLDIGWTLIGHLGMSGRLTILDGPPSLPGKHDHFELLTTAGTTVRYNDPRRFGFMDLSETKKLSQHPMLSKLGPEPLSNEFNAVTFVTKLKRRRSPIKTALLDQKIVAGLGNIYACEALFQAAISPLCKAETIRGFRAERLVIAIRSVLTAAIAAGGSSLRNYRQVDGELGYFQNNWQVYNHEGESCLRDNCDGLIRRITQSGRSTFYCGRHQK